MNFPSDTPDWQLLLRAAFFAALVFAFMMATLPHPPEIPGNPNDKLLHIVTFMVLTALLSLAYPGAGVGKRLVMLSGFGALIEVVQAIPVLQRDASILDWLAGSAAILVTFALIRLIRGESAGRA